MIIKHGKWLLFLFFIVFPFGQLLGLNVRILGFTPTFHALDFIAGLSFLLAVLGIAERPKVFTYFKNFFVVALYSLILSYLFFPTSEVLFGSLYFIRLIFWAYFFVMVWSLIRERILKRHTVLKAFIVVCVAASVYGWIQYIFIPDLTSLVYIGWDDHFYRLAGTFLDPGFTGIIAVLGFLASFSYYLKDKKRKYLIISLFLLASLAFTYSRASYLALITGCLYLLYQFKKVSRLFVLILVFLLILPLLPRPGGEGVRLERTQSIYAKVDNYRETLEIIGEYPLFGVGYNNICSEKLGEDKFESHACPGSDSSLLLVLATTGITGFLSFLYILHKAWISSKHAFFGKVFLSGLIAVLTHSVFVNSLFYPWVLAPLFIMFALSID